MTQSGYTKKISGRIVDAAAARRACVNMYKYALHAALRVLRLRLYRTMRFYYTYGFGVCAACLLSSRRGAAFTLYGAGTRFSCASCRDTRPRKHHRAR